VACRAGTWPATGGESIPFPYSLSSFLGRMGIFVLFVAGTP
jgi:hypothetical protein